MVSDQVQERLTQMVDGTGRSLDWALEQYEENLEQIEDRAMESLTDDQKREFALGMIEDDQLFKDRVGGSGEEMELEILAIGQGGEMNEWGQDDDDVVYSYGFIFGPLGDDGQEKAAKAVFVNKKSDDVDLREIQRMFHAGNTMKGVYEVSESRDLDNVYRCFSCGATDPVEQELDSLPTDREDKLEILRQAVPEASLASLHDDLTAYDPESGYTYDFGADLRRIDARIVDYYIGEDNSWGRYTIMDDSVTEDDVVGTDIVGDEQNVPGLTVWADPQYHMEYGRKSRVEMYGTVEEGTEGNLVMNLVGIIPKVPMPMDDDDQADENVNATESEL